MLMSVFNSIVKSIPCQSNNVTADSADAWILIRIKSLSCAELCQSASTDTKMEKQKTQMSVNITIVITELIFYSSIFLMK
jgi:hypothetical protein